MSLLLVIAAVLVGLKLSGRLQMQWRYMILVALAPFLVTALFLGLYLLLLQL